MDFVPGLNLDPLYDPRNDHMLGFHVCLGVTAHPGEHFIDLGLCLLVRNASFATMLAL